MVKSMLNEVISILNSGLRIWWQHGGKHKGAIIAFTILCIWVVISTIFAIGYWRLWKKEKNRKISNRYEFRNY